MEGRESFVDDLIGYRVLYGVRDALLHRSLEIQPWYSRFVIILISFISLKGIEEKRTSLSSSLHFFCVGGIVGSLPASDWRLAALIESKKLKLKFLARPQNRGHDTLPEWLRGSPAKRVCFARTGSNPVGVA